MPTLSELLRAGDTDGAEKLARKAYAEDPRHAGYSRQLAGVLLAKGAVTEALSVLESAVLDHPQDLALRFTLARARHRLGDYTTALSDAQQGLALSRTLGDAAYIDSLLVLIGDCLLKLDRPLAATQVLQAAKPGTLVMAGYLMRARDLLKTAEAGVRAARAAR